MQLLCVGNVKLSCEQSLPPIWTFPADFSPGSNARLLFNWEMGCPVDGTLSSSAAMLKKWSPGIAALANGRSLEAREEDLACAIRSLQQAGFKTLGAGMTAEEAANPLLWETAEGDLTILNWVFSKPSAEEPQPRVNSWPGLMNAGDIIRSVKRTSDWVLVILHWNDGPFLHPHPEHREIARQIAGFGADAVIGDHPYAARGMEFVGSCPVFYGLGTFFSTREKQVLQEASPTLPPRSWDSLAVRFNFLHGKPPGFDLISFWNDGFESRRDPIERAFRRMNSSSRILFEHQGESYLDWYEKLRIRLEQRSNVLSLRPLGRELSRNIRKWALRVKVF